MDCRRHTTHWIGRKELDWLEYSKEDDLYNPDSNGNCTCFISSNYIGVGQTFTSDELIDIHSCIPKDLTFTPFIYKD